MLDCDVFAEACRDLGFTFFTGVPDSTLGEWLTYLDRPDVDLDNLVAVNECEATALAAGYHLATGKTAVVYLQNDGLGKCVNPLTSLTNEAVYSIPILLLIGWRGEPGRADAPQHQKMGEILPDLLDLLDVPHTRLPANPSGAADALRTARSTMAERSTPYALLVSRETFAPEDAAVRAPNEGRRPTVSREAAVRAVVDSLAGDEILVATTGKLARELYEYREAADVGHERDFYNVGAMGCAQSIGLGLSLGRPDRPIVVLDGDGSLLMQLGAMATAGHRAPSGFHHVVFDNGAHDSTGGQPTASSTVDFDAVATACGYRSSHVVDGSRTIADAIRAAIGEPGPTLTVVPVDRGARADLGRPDVPLSTLKRDLMARIDETS